MQGLKDSKSFKNPALSRLVLSSNVNGVKIPITPTSDSHLLQLKLFRLSSSNAERWHRLSQTKANVVQCVS